MLFLVMVVVMLWYRPEQVPDFIVCVLADMRVDINQSLLQDGRSDGVRHSKNPPKPKNSTEPKPQTQAQARQHQGKTCPCHAPLGQATRLLTRRKAQQQGG